MEITCGERFAEREPGIELKALVEIGHLNGLQIFSHF